jgi:uncharacterized protein (TIGR03083 family)
MPVMSANSYLGQVLPALDDTAGRFAALVASAPDTTVPVPGSPGWTVRDVAAHLASVAVRYSDGPEGRGIWTPTPGGLAGLNDDQIAALGTASAGELAAQMQRHLGALRAQIQGYGGQMPAFRFHGGEQIRADIALGILLGELVVHGHDVARALGRPWPIDPGHVGLIVEGLNPVLPGWVRPDRIQGLTASFEMRLRGQASHIWAFQNGRLHVDPPRPGRIDVHISGDPAALLLYIYTRESQWKLIATGQLAAWGRRPWLAFTLRSRFHTP